MNSYVVATRSDLPPLARLAIPVLEKLAKGHDTCLSATRTIAEKLGCCERSARNALNALRAAGLIEIARDYSLRTRRRIVLLWRQAREVFPFVAANTCPDSPPTFAVTCASPPIEIPEGVSKEKERDDEPAPSPLPAPSDDQRRKATPDEIEAAVSKAAPILRREPAATRAWVVATAKRWRLSWLLAALEKAEAKTASEPLKSPSGYVVNTLRGFEVEGGPPAPPPKPPTAEEWIARLDAIEAEREAFAASLRS